MFQDSLVNMVVIITLTLATLLIILIFILIVKGKSRKAGYVVIILMVILTIGATVSITNDLELSEKQLDKYYDKEVIEEKEYEENYGAIYVDGYKVEQDLKVMEGTVKKGTYQEVVYTLKDKFNSKIYENKREDYIVYK